MHLDSDELLARIRQDYPYEYEMAQLKTLVDALTRENEQLKAGQASPLTPVVGTYSASNVRPYVGTDEDVARHGG